MGITTHQIRTALMYYCRFERQWICAPEISFGDGYADMLADTGKAIYEIEIKISKGDLWHGEARKEKHIHPLLCNKFYICVPEELSGEAQKWVATVNLKYGIMIYHLGNIRMLKKAEELRSDYPDHLRERIIKRLSCMVYFFMKKSIFNPNRSK